ncbi:MAG: 4Fe-4S binding protein [Desulfosudaceae bacterium]
MLEVAKCVGCGLCVTTCKPGAIQLAQKEVATVPPVTTEDLYETIMKNKKSKVGKYVTAARAALGLKV